jgi:tetratricopeptide (TPR) repeat protein
MGVPWLCQGGSKNLTYPEADTAGPSTRVSPRPQSKQKRGRRRVSEAIRTTSPIYGLSHSGKLDGAVAAYHDALQIKPDYAKALHYLGTALYDQGKHEAAVAEFWMALRINPDDATMHCNLGAALTSLDFHGGRFP